jgi:hypothetical protein
MLHRILAWKYAGLRIGCIVCTSSRNACDFLQFVILFMAVKLLFAGMSKEIENLILENQELLATK